jgi:AraC-like DNA-binding protein
MGGCKRVVAQKKATAMLKPQQRAGLSARAKLLDCKPHGLMCLRCCRKLGLMRHAVSTDHVEPRQRLAFWTDMVCSTYVQLDCDAAAGAATVEGHIESEALATLQLSKVTATAQTVRRTSAKISRASEDYFLVSIQTQGVGNISQDGRTARLAPGDFALYDSTRPYTLQFDAPFAQYVLRLRDPALSVEGIAAQLRLSPSTLHCAWAGEACSIAEWVWAQRLDSAQRDLCNPSQRGRSVSEIAFAWGFNDAAHFSRAFRARFGCAPRDLRLRPHPLPGPRC